MAGPDKSYIAGSQQSSPSVRSFDISSKTGEKTAVHSKLQPLAKFASLPVHDARSTDASIGKWLTARNRIELDYPLQLVKVVNGRVKGRFTRSARRDRAPTFSKSAHIRVNFIICIDTRQKAHVMSDRGADIAVGQLHHSMSTAITALAFNAYYINNEFVFVTASADGAVNIYKFAYDSFKKSGAISLHHSFTIAQGEKKTRGIEYVKNAHILYKKSTKQYEFYFSTSFGRNAMYKGAARGQMAVSLVDADMFPIRPSDTYSPSSPIVESFQSNVYFVYLRDTKLVINKKLVDRTRQAIFDVSMKQAQVTADNGDEKGTFANGTITGFYVDDKLVNMFLLTDMGYVTLYKILKGDSKVVFSDLKYMKTFRYHTDSLATIANDAKSNKDDVKNSIKQSNILVVGNERYLIQSKRCMWHFFDPRDSHYSARIDASYSGCFNGSTDAYKAYNKNGFGGIKFETAPDTDTFKPANVLNPEKAKYRDTLLFVVHNVRDKKTGFLNSLLGKSFYKGAVLTVYKGTSLHESALQNVIDSVRPFAFALVVLVIVFIRYTLKGGRGGRGGKANRKNKLSLGDTVACIKRRIDENESLTEEEKAERLGLLLEGERLD